MWLLLESICPLSRLLAGTLVLVYMGSVENGPPRRVWCNGVGLWSCVRRGPARNLHRPRAVLNGRDISKCLPAQAMHCGQANRHPTSQPCILN